MDEQAYTPKVILIDPIHHKLETMENHKVRYFKIFITRTETNLENLVITISEMEEHIQCCYAETILLSMYSDDFVKLILAHVMFITGLFFRSNNKYWESDDLMKRDDRVGKNGPLPSILEIICSETLFPNYIAMYHFFGPIAAFS